MQVLVNCCISIRFSLKKNCVFVNATVNVESREQIEILNLRHGVLPGGFLITQKLVKCEVT